MESIPIDTGVVGVVRNGLFYVHDFLPGKEVGNRFRRGDIIYSIQVITPASHINLWDEQAEANAIEAINVNGNITVWVLRCKFYQIVFIHNWYV